MTKQQIKDYESAHDLIYLKMWISDAMPDSVTNEQLLKLPLKCAISDIETFIDDYNSGALFDVKPQQIRAAKQFLRKYKQA